MINFGHYCALPVADQSFFLRGAKHFCTFWSIHVPFTVGLNKNKINNFGALLIAVSSLRGGGQGSLWSPDYIRYWIEGSVFTFEQFITLKWIISLFSFFFLSSWYFQRNIVKWKVRKSHFNIVLTKILDFRYLKENILFWGKIWRGY